MKPYADYEAAFAALGLDYNDMAAVAGVSRYTLYRWRRGDLRKPSSVEPIAARLDHALHAAALFRPPMEYADELNVGRAVGMHADALGDASSGPAARMIATLTEQAARRRARRESDTAKRYAREAAAAQRAAEREQEQRAAAEQAARDAAQREQEEKRRALLQRSIDSAREQPSGPPGARDTRGRTNIPPTLQQRATARPGAYTGGWR